jgi:hypothetical protein
MSVYGRVNDIEISTIDNANSVVVRLTSKIFDRNAVNIFNKSNPILTYNQLKNYRQSKSMILFDV